MGIRILLHRSRVHYRCHLTVHRYYRRFAYHGTSAAAHHRAYYGRGYTLELTAATEENLALLSTIIRQAARLGLVMLLVLSSACVCRRPS